MSLFFDLFRREPNIRYLDEGEFLFREGEHGPGEMYVLVSGSAEILVGGAVVEEAGAGSILGEMGLIERREPRSASVRAVTRCSVAVIDEKRFHYLVTEAPQFAVEVMRVLARRLRNADRLLAGQG